MVDHQQDLSEIYEKFIKVFQHKATPEELDYIRSWITKDKGNKQVFDEYREIWYATNRSSNATDYNPEQAWNRLSKQFSTIQNVQEPPAVVPLHPEDETHEPQLWFKVLRIAALVVVAFGLGMLATTTTQKAEIKDTKLVYSEHIVPLGAKAQVVLPDGTKVWLNAGSKLKYSQNYNHEIREVLLDGEGYFDVKSNKEVPFWVVTYGAKIKVVGTAFNVKAYREEGRIETTVERGEIKVYGCEKLDLPENEMSITVKQKLDIPTAKLNTDQKTAVNVKKETSQELTLKDNVATELYTSWKDKQWIIEREELGSLAVKIERRYDVTIHFQSEELKHNVFSGLIENETLDQLLRAVCLTSVISYKIDKKDVYLKTNNMHFAN